MPRRILFKENELTGSAPTGYRFVGIKDSKLSTVGTNSQITEEFNTPQNFIVASALYGSEDLGGGFIVGPSRVHKIDYDLSGGNYSTIFIDNRANFKSFKLPVYHGRNLFYSRLEVQTLSSTPTEITLSNYPNLSCIKGTGLCYNGSKPYNFEIKDEVIDLPNLKAIGFYGSKECTPVKTQPSLRIVAHPNCNYSLASNNLSSLELDFSSFTYSFAGTGNDDTEYYYNVGVLSQNVSYLTFSNLSTYDTNLNSCVFNFIFDGMPLTQTCIDDILSKLDTAFPNNISNSTISIYQEHSISGGQLVIGESYLIESLNGSDDFSNVGFVSTGVSFVATGAYPNDWSSSTSVYTFYGIPLSFTLSFVDQVLPDGKYYNEDFYLEVNSGVITHSEILTPNDTGNNSYYPGYQWALSGEDFYLLDEYGRITFQGLKSIHEVLVTVNSVTRPQSATDGQNNTNKLSLESKGWTVNINSYGLPI